MGLFDLFSKSPEKKLGEQFDRAIDSVIKSCGGNPLIAGVMTYSTLANTYDSLKHNDAMILKCGLSKSDYLQLLDRVLDKKGHEYISNWDQMKKGPERDPMDLDYMDSDYMDLDF